MSTEWHYSIDGEKHGPVSSAELKELAANGELSPSDLIWKDGMDAWVTANKVKGLFAATSASHLPSQKIAAAPARPAAGKPAAAKPAAVKPAQRKPVAATADDEDEDEDEYDEPLPTSKSSKNTKPARGKLEYGGFFVRFAASIVDGILILLIDAAMFIIAMVLFMLIGESSETAKGIISFCLLIACGVVPWLYFAMAESSEKQTTLGKRLFGLKVTNLNGERISFGRATGRFIAKVLSQFPLVVGHLLALVTEKRQAFHDLLAGTIVVKA